MSTIEGGIEDIRNYLTASHRMRTDPQFGLNEPTSYEGVVLSRGRVYTTFGEVLPEGEPQECYANCSAVIFERSDLTYVEGWAVSYSVPVQHAWLVDADGKVSDPTWGHRENAVYMGIEFTRDEIIEVMQESTYGFCMLYPSTPTHPVLEVDA